MNVPSPVIDLTDNSPNKLNLKPWLNIKEMVTFPLINIITCIPSINRDITVISYLQEKYFVMCEFYRDYVSREQYVGFGFEIEYMRLLKSKLNVPKMDNTFLQSQLFLESFHIFTLLLNEKNRFPIIIFFDLILFFEWCRDDKDVGSKDHLTDALNKLRVMLDKEANLINNSNTSVIAFHTWKKIWKII